MISGDIPSDVVEQRQQYLNTVTKFISEQKEKLDRTLERLGLTTEKLLQVEKKQVCPYNRDHVIPEKCFKKHTEKCKYLSAGYQRDELCDRSKLILCTAPALLQNVDFCYENADSVMKIDIDENMLNKIIWDHCVQNGQVYTGHRTMGASHIDDNINLTQEDRLAVYRYVVTKSHEAGKVIPIERSDELLTTDWASLVKKGLLDEQNNKQYSSKLEQLAALRDLKRRRQSYRAKNVHITKKSYKEIIREVIINQMEILVPGSSKNYQPTTSSEDYQDSRQEDEHTSRRENQRRDRRDCSPPQTRRDRSRDDGDHRSRDSHRKRSYNRHEDRSRSRDRFQGDYRSRDESRSSRRSRDESWSSRRSRDESRSSRRSRERSRHRERDGDEMPPAPRGFTEADNAILKELKQESTTEVKDVAHDASVVRMEDCEETQDETKLCGKDGSSHDSQQKSSRKRSYDSDSDSDNSSEKRRNKHKKSKHKKKHSKKHKRRD